MNIGERIKKRRIELGLSVDEIAKQLNKNRATIYRYENGDIENLPISVLEPLSKVLRTTPGDLMLESPNNLPELNKKDEREIESDLEDMMHSMSSAAYEGEGALEDVEAFKATLKSAMIQAKRIAKKKYTPKKYRKD